MTDEQISQLQAMLRAGKRLAWEDSSRRLYEIKGVDVIEDEVAAVFTSGWGALHNIEPEDILLFSQPFVSDEPPADGSD